MRGPSRIVVPSELRGHADRVRWNARYRGAAPDFEPHPFVAAAQTAGLPDGPVLELACGRSGSALAFAAAGRRVVAVEISDLALTQLADEAARRGLDGNVECVMADIPTYDPGPERFALVMATFYLSLPAFRTACLAVRPGGLLGWEAQCSADDGRPSPWRIPHGELSARLPPGFEVLSEDVHGPDRRRSTRLLARRTS